MTPKQKRLKKIKRHRVLIKIKKIILGLFFISMVILSISLILGAL